MHNGHFRQYITVNINTRDRTCTIHFVIVVLRRCDRTNALHLQLEPHADVVWSAAPRRRTGCIGSAAAVRAIYRRRVGTNSALGIKMIKMTKLLQFSYVHFSICLFYYL